MSRIAKGIAFAAGAGLAVSLIAKIGGQSARQDLIETEVERRLKAHAAALEADFAGSIERAVAEQVVTLERELLAQSVSIQTLRVRGEAADIHMQRLIDVVRQLFPERAEEPTLPSGFPPSFEAQLERALGNPQPQREFREPA